MTTAVPSGMAMNIVDEYEKKVREIAVAQCRCETGADLVVKKAKDEHQLMEHAQAA